MIIHNPVITGSLQVNGTSVSSIDQVDNISGSVVTLTDASASLASRVTGVESSVNSLNTASSSYALQSLVSGAFDSVSASLASNIETRLLNTTDTLDGDLTVTGKITAQEFHTEFVSASIIYQSGSTQFGDSADDVHQFTGKVGVGTSTPSPNADTAYNYIQIGESAVVSGYNSGASLLAVGENFYWNSGWKYLTSAPASTHQMNTGTHSFRVASSGTADGSLTWISALDINNSGNVGIGTSNPVYRLDVEGDASFIKGIQLVPSESNFYQQAGALSYYGVTNGVYLNGAGTNGFLRLNGDAVNDRNSIDIYGSNIDIISFKTAASERMRITSSGNVGIGTTTPSDKLVVYGGNLSVANTNTSFSIVPNYAGQGALLAGTLLCTNNVANNNLNIIPDSGGNVSSVVLAAYNGSSWYSMLEYGNVASGVPNLFLAKGGSNVGIGTTNPYSTLVVARATTNTVNTDDASNTSHITVSGNDANVRLQLGVGNSTLGPFSGWIQASYDNGGVNHGVEPLLLNPIGGCVGIGTTSPSAKLTINGPSAAIATSGTADGGTLRLTEQPSSGATLLFGTNGGNYGYIQMTNTADLSAGYPLVLNPNSGNVGIGTTSPAENLDVIGNVLIGTGTKDNERLVIRHGNGTGHYGVIRFNDSVADVAAIHNFPSTWQGGNIYGSTGAININGQNGVTLGTWPDPDVVFPNGGSSYFKNSVGIGATSVVSKLQVGANTFNGTHGVYSNARSGLSVNGSLTSIVYASTYNDATYPDYGMVFVHGGSTSSYNVWSISPDGPARGDSLNFIYGQNATNIHTATPKVVFDGSGNVGIGKTNPKSTLHVKRTTNDMALLVENSTGGVGAYVDIGFNTYNTDQAGWANPAAAIRAIDNGAYGGHFAFLSKGAAVGASLSEIVRIQNDASVGINTTAPKDKLHVRQGKVVTDDGYANHQLAIFNSGNAGTYGGSLTVTIPNTENGGSSVGYGGYSCEIYVSGYSGHYCHAWFSGYTNQGITVGESTILRSSTGWSISQSGGASAQSIVFVVDYPTLIHPTARIIFNKGGDNGNPGYDFTGVTVAWS